MLGDTKLLRREVDGRPGRLRAAMDRCDRLGLLPRTFCPPIDRNGGSNHCLEPRLERAIYLSMPAELVYCPNTGFNQHKPARGDDVYVVSDSCGEYLLVVSAKFVQTVSVGGVALVDRSDGRVHRLDVHRGPIPLDPQPAEF